MVLKELVEYLELLYPGALQESYDNSGLIAGEPEQEINSALVALDVSEAVIDEAIARNCQLVISHHPTVFHGIKRITGSNTTERILIKAIRSRVALYAAHTSLDNAQDGLNNMLCLRLGIRNPRVLSPKSGFLRKLVCFVPLAHAEKVRQALFDAGAGTIGAYDCCSYNSTGEGTFRGGDQSHPFVGEKGHIHTEPEMRIETIFPVHQQKSVIRTLLSVHPYEEAAYDIYPLENMYSLAGSGMIGMLESPVSEEVYLGNIKKALGCAMMRHSGFTGKAVQKVAVCGGSGSFLISEAIHAGADVFVTADMKYHQFSEAENCILLVDAGHFETEQFAKELFYDVLIKKFPNFAVRFSETETNPVKYY